MISITKTPFLACSLLLSLGFIAARISSSINKEAAERIDLFKASLFLRDAAIITALLSIALK